MRTSQKKSEADLMEKLMMLAGWPVFLSPHLHCLYGHLWFHGCPDRVPKDGTGTWWALNTSLAAFTGSYMSRHLNLSYLKFDHDIIDLFFLILKIFLEKQILIILNAYSTKTISQVLMLFHSIVPRMSS